MSSRLILTWIVAAGIVQCGLAQGTAQAKEQPAARTDPRQKTTGIALRATTVRAAGIVSVDRGERDGLRKGDRVVFHPRGQKSLGGRVRSVQQRNAEIQLNDPSAKFALGTRGIVHIPLSRFQVEKAPSQDTPEPSADALHAPWENQDMEFVEGMPLLAAIDGVPPEDRLPLISGRLYSVGETRITSDDKRADSFLRIGTELNYENPFGLGGQLNFEGEVNYRDTFVNEQVNESTTKGRLDRLSYAWGGTRFQPERHELGRFLQHGMPEFGVIDGYEWNRRLSNGDSAGTSVGFLPEPTASMASLEDFSVAAYYRWTADKRERVTATGAFQKTWHNSAPDRDLFIAKFNYWADEGWDMHATSWIDYYSSGDEAKGEGFELTRMIASSSRRWIDGDALNFTLTHRSFPLIDRNEFLPVLVSQLDRAHNDRLSSDGWTWLKPNQKLHGRLGVWTDQEDSGSDGEIGIEQHGVLAKNARLDASLFAIDGKFSTTYGVRLDYGIQLSERRWDLSYEFSLNDQVGFTDDNDDLEQHRLIGSFDHTSTSGWSFSIHGGAILWGQETALLASFYLQKSF